MKEKDVHSKLYVRAAIKKNPLKPVLSFKSDARLRSKAHPGNQAQAEAKWGQNHYEVVFSFLNIQQGLEIHGLKIHGLEIHGLEECEP